MKILIVSDLYPLDNKDRTIPNFLEEFALAFKAAETEVEIVRPNFLINTFLRGHRIYKNGTYFKNEIKIYNRNFILPFIFNKFSPDFKPDLIISHMPSGHIFANLLNKKLNVKHLAIVHQSDYTVLEDFKYKFYFKRKLQKALKEADLIGARNKFLKEKFNATFILPSFVEKERIVLNKEYKQSGKLKLITLSKLIKRKNINLVIEALGEVDFDFEYEIFGEGKERKNLEKLIKKYNLQNKIKIHPFIEHSGVYEKLDKSDVFILPSIKESFGISYIEAMARGLIVIGCKNTGIDGFLKNNENGFLVNPNKTEIVEVLNKINDDNMENIMKNSLSNIKNFEKEEVMKKYFEIIKKIL